MRYLIVVVALMLVAGCVMADDIVTMPTANQLKAGDVDVAAYYLGLDMPSALPQSVNYQTLYVGLTDKLELDVHRADVDKDDTSNVIVAQYKMLSETAVKPDLVFGVRNLTGESTTLNPAFKGKTEDRSYYLAAAKTFFFNPAAPGAPLVRVHLGVGTEDWTLLNEGRHEGIFGGLQFLLRSDLGAVIENDGTDTITGLTYMPKNTGLTVKGGTYGDHWWAGVAYRKALNF